MLPSPGSTNRKTCLRNFHLDILLKEIEKDQQCLAFFFMVAVKIPRHATVTWCAKDSLSLAIFNV